MKISIAEITGEDLSRIIKKLKLELPLWLYPELSESYSDRMILTAKKGEDLAGFWIIPITRIDNQVIARRDLRYFPYASPFILESDNIKRREVIQEFFRYLKKKVESISLPMHIGFTDLPGVQALGVFVEWRHTHIIRRNREIKLSSRLKNNISFAKKNSTLHIHTDPSKFAFDKAIKGNDLEVKKRGKLAEKLLENRQGIIIEASEGSKVTGGIVIFYDNFSSYLLHSWRDENACRGVIAWIILNGIDWIFKNTKVDIFDFEGSIIQDIDYFYAGFNAEITPYGFIHWADSDKSFFDQIKRAINIEGRILNN